MRDLPPPTEETAPRPTGVAHRAWWPPLVAAVASGVLLMQVRTAGLWSDDVANLREHAGGSLLDLLLRPVALRQVAPGHRLLTQLQFEIGPTDRVLMHALLAVLAGATVLLATRAAAAVGHRSWWFPVAVAVVVTGPAGVSAASWYAGAYHVIPSMALGLAAVVAHLRWRAPTAEGELHGVPVAAVAITLLATMFSLKALLAPLAMLLLEYVVLPQPAPAMARLRRAWRVWLPYAVIGLGHLAGLTLLGVPASPGPPVGAALATLSGVTTVSVPLVVGLLPPVLGAARPLAIGLGWLVVGGLALRAVQRRAVAPRALVAAGLVVTASVGLPTLVTAAEFGVVAGAAPRYHLEGLVLAWVLVVAGRPVPSPPGARDRGRRGHGVLLVAVVAAVLVSTGAQRATSPPHLAGRWIAAVEADLGAAAEPPAVLDTPLPPYVVDLVPGRPVSDLVGLVPDLRVDARADHVLTADGRVEPLRTTVLSRQTGAEFATNALVDVSGEPTVRGTRLCTADRVTIELLLGPHPEPRLLGLGLEGTADVAVTTVPLPGRPTPPPAVVPAVTGIARLPLDLLGWSDRVVLEVRALEGAQACVPEVTVLQVDNDLPGYGDLAP